MGDEWSTVSYEIGYIVKAVLRLEKHVILFVRLFDMKTPITLIDKDHDFQKSKIYIEIENNRLFKLYVCRINEYNRHDMLPTKQNPMY